MEEPVYRTTKMARLNAFVKKVWLENIVRKVDYSFLMKFVKLSRTSIYSSAWNTCSV